ncbi:hypothetical protein CHS0354_028845 [Potamilus streckersoni]|uniref:Leucine-rich melanocyte differentiation-associated protein n=1 Tax=Potamilus streckersoni TaxID=2493646 RepID=A0AAE0TG70_9BIVA|nr:hypothetical protein CHS0354_028845 [Potamilus streckersoni]
MAEDEGKQEEIETESKKLQPEADKIQISFQDGQLSCIGEDIEEIPMTLVDSYSKVTRRLDLSFNKLRNLQRLEEFPNLEELILDNNELGDDAHFPTLKLLHTLTLNKNKLTNLEQLLQNIQNNLPNLTYLSLLGNIACPNQLSAQDKDEEDYQRYRYYVLYRLPSLKFLDSTTVSKEELAEAKRTGSFMRVVRATEEEIEGAYDVSGSSPGSSFSPLPKSTRAVDQHIGTFGKSKYIYYGRHSEGNRFIRNNDL